MVKLLGISGSLRAGSFNTALLNAAAALAPEGVEVSVATLAGIPLYDGDLEAREGLPAAVVALKARIQASDGLILATPEYNAGLPGVLKNGIDWLTRPPEDLPKTFGDRPLALLGASPSGFGTVLGQNAWLPVLRFLGVRQWSAGRLLVSRAHQLIGADGSITDDALRTQLRDFVAGFASFCA